MMELEPMSKYNNRSKTSFFGEKIIMNTNKIIFFLLLATLPLFSMSCVDTFTYYHELRT